MAYQIEKCEGFFEVRVWGETSKFEVLQIIRELDRRDRGKRLPDLWVVAEESQIPFLHYSEIAQAIRGLLPPDAAGSKSAIVAAGQFHMAQLQMFQSEAAILPYEVRVFLSRDEAVEWLRIPEGQAAAVHRC